MNTTERKVVSRESLRQGEFMIKNLLVFISAIAIAVMYTGCTSHDSTPSAVLSPLSSPVLPSDNKTQWPPVPPIPTPSSKSVAVVGGVILREIAGRPLQPMAGGVLLLSSVRIAQGRAVIAVVEEDDDPQAVVSETGAFVFTDVRPGVYTLVYKTPAGTFVLRDPKSGKDLIIRVREGEVVNLGELRYNLPY